VALPLSAASAEGVTGDAISFGQGFAVLPPTLPFGSAYALVSPIWAYTIATWWLEGQSQAVTKLSRTFVPLLAGSSTLEMQTLVMTG